MLRFVLTISTEARMDTSHSRNILVSTYTEFISPAVGLFEVSPSMHDGG